VELPVLTVGASAVVMGGALWSDLRYQRIPNVLTYPAFVAGFVLAFAHGGLDGVLSAALGAALGFFVLFVGYMFGGIGGGDVKLAAALGALAGLDITTLGLLYMGLLAGVLAFGILIWKGKLLASLRRMGRFLFTALIPFLETEKLDVQNSDPFPLGVAIVGGFAWALVETHFGAGNLFGGILG
jgi:prepilin peptidase CpaA